jgi:hypothetical protein
MNISAYFLVAMCKGLFSSSSTLALWSHETAEVLSPRARKQQYSSGKSSSIVVIVFNEGFIFWWNFPSPG